MGTFGSFSVARLGIYAAQSGLDVTGNNITNINTQGYTRQRLDQVSLGTGGSDKYYSRYNVKVGQGVLTAGVSQLRDPGLDLQYRGATANVGSAAQKLEGLNSLATILDEVGKGNSSDQQDDGVILSQMNDLRDLINKAVTNGIDGYDSIIRESADALCTLFNKYAKELENLQDAYETKLDQSVTEINNILENIRNLNQTIRDADIRGDDALELRDERNRQLDALSEYIDIDVKYTMEDLGAGLMVEKLEVTMGTGGQHHLVDGIYNTQLSVDNDNNYEVTLSELKDQDGEVQDGSTAKVLGDNELYGSLQSLRELLTESGEYADKDMQDADPDAAIKRGIPYYINALNSLAFEFAEQMNALNTVSTDPDNPVVKGEGVLFSTSTNNNETDGITAANISVSKDWAERRVSMIASRDPNASSGDNSNLAAFLNVFSKTHEFMPGDVAAGAVGAPFGGSFEDMLLHIESTLAEEQMSTTAVLNNYSITQSELYTNRESVSGVDLNDEATNLMVYQKAYTAACRLMTTLDEALNALFAM